MHWMTLMCPGPPPSVTSTNPLTQTLKCHLIDSLASTFFPLPLKGPQNQQGKLVANGNGLGSKVRPTSRLVRAGGKFSTASGAPFPSIKAASSLPGPQFTLL